MSKKHLLNRLRIADPCNQAWEEMTGNRQVRFCSHCAKDVNNISTMTRKDVRRLVRRSGGNLCVRYVEHPKTKAPLFPNDLIRITRRAPSLAAGVVGVTLSLASLNYAQGGVRTERIEITRTAEPDKENPGSEERAGSAKVAGVLVDTQGAVIPGLALTLKERKSGSEINTAAVGDGSFSFEGLPPGTYFLRIDGGGLFKDKTLSNITLAEGQEKFQTVELEIDERRYVAGGIAISSEVEFRSDLSRAVYSEELADVLELLARGADPNEAEEDGETPLFISVGDGTLEIARALLDHGADANAKNEEGENVLFRLDDETPLELVELLVSAGADVNQTAKDGKTPLIAAAEYASPGVLKALLDAGAKVNAADEEGWTALMKAAFEDSIEKVRLLVFAGADVNARKDDDETALAQTEDDDVKALLISFGATFSELFSNDDEEDDEDPDI